MKKSTVAIAIASALAANQELAMAVTCTANSDATLRACISNAANGDVISVATDITLSSFLPDITKNVTVQGNNRRISGNNAHRVFWVESGTVAIQNLTIANGLAQGGSGGGGGAGLGAGLFVNSGTVTLSNLTFTQNAAKGGIGGDDYGTGGGGMGGYGTNSGGGGRLPGDNGTANGGFGGGGVGGDDGGFGGGGGNGVRINYLSNGGSGGFGGGGGAGFGYSYYPGYCGYYGCYGGYTIYGQGGSGGFGAGAGAYGKSGGGLGAGAAIFAKAGALTLKKVAFTQNSNSGGSGGYAGQGKAALFICTSTENASCTATVAANSCGVTFSGNTASNAGTTDTDNADTFKVSRTNLMKSCVAPPIAVTNAPSVITTTSARLSGTVNPNGAATTASFNFGPTTTYGTNIAATPATIAATAAATNVSADKPGLTCSKTYHYRVAAVSSAGTTVGTDKSFTTSACTTNKADLIITNAVLTPASPVANSTFTATVTVKNQGTVAGDGKFLDVWSNQSTAQVCGAVGNKRVAVGILAAGASKILTVTGLPAGTAGSKILRAFVDSGCGTAETNEGNNQRTVNYSVNPASGVDFVVTNVTLNPAAPSANGTFNATVTVKNQGTVAGDGKLLNVWSNQPNAQVCGAVGNKQQAVGSLAAGASKSLTFSGLPAGIAGAKTFRAFVDSGCGTAENNEANNQLVKTFTVITSPVVINIQSTAFTNGAVIPTEYTCDGADVSPPLSWNGIPNTTQSMVLLVTDPTAANFVHWVAYNISSSTSNLSVGIPNIPVPSANLSQGINGFGSIGYGGPCPPSGSGSHTYVFNLLALDTSLSLTPGATATYAAVLAQTNGHVVGTGTLKGTYTRP